MISILFINWLRVGFVLIQYIYVAIGIYTFESYWFALLYTIRSNHILYINFSHYFNLNSACSNHGQSLWTGPQYQLLPLSLCSLSYLWLVLPHYFYPPSISMYPWFISLEYNCLLDCNALMHSLCSHWMLQLLSRRVHIPRLHPVLLSTHFLHQKSHYSPSQID